MEYMKGRTSNDSKTITVKNNNIEESTLLNDTYHGEAGLINKINQQEEKLQKVILSLENVAEVMKLSVTNEGQGRRVQKCWYHVGLRNTQNK